MADVHGSEGKFTKFCTEWSEFTLKLLIMKVLNNHLILGICISNARVHDTSKITH